MVILKEEIVSFFFHFVLFATIYHFVNDKMEFQRREKSNSLKITQLVVAKMTFDAR